MGEFVKKTMSLNPREIKTVTANTTLTNADSQIKVNGTYTITLPAISTLSGLGNSEKAYIIENVGTGIVTISPNSADSIGPASASSWTLNSTNDVVYIASNRQANNWEILTDAPLINTVNILDGAITGAKTSLTKQYGTIVADTSGTDPVTAITAPVAFTITSVDAGAQDTNAGNMIVKNGTDTVASFAKSTTQGLVTREDGALTNASVAAAAVVTVESSTTNGDGKIHIYIEATE